jgi:hypothetical protein
MLQPVRKRKLGVTANVMLSLIDWMKVVALLHKRYSQIEANAYHTHSQVALSEGMEEIARRVVAHFENQLEVNEAIGHDQGIHSLCKVNV